jgi:hypothetical protein
MSMQSEGKDAKGRNYDQVTQDGTSSAAGMGAGATGDVGAMGGPGADQGAGQGSRQSASRTDDLLATSNEEADQAFAGGSQGGLVQTGMEGIGKGGGAGRQSDQPANQQSGQPAARQASMPSGETDPDQYDQGTAPRER